MINEKNNNDLKIKREKENLKKKINRQAKIAEMKEKKIKKKLINELNNKKREKEKLELLRKTKNVIYNNLDTKMIIKVYKNRSKKKKVINYEKYEGQVKDKLVDNIINYELTKTFKYYFKNKEAFIIKADAFTFTENNIINIMNKIDIQKYIDKIDDEIE